MGETAIQWTGTPRDDGTIAPGYTFNPWIGCEKVSPECDHCYAESGSKRLAAQHGLKLWEEDRYITSKTYWDKPRLWNKKAAARGERAKVFCASYADVFEDRPDLAGTRARLFEVIDATPNLDWLLLTKRPENIGRMLPPFASNRGVRHNVWLGTTVGIESSKHRADDLVRGPDAVVKFLSIEPMLGPLHITSVLQAWMSTIAAQVIRGAPAILRRKLDWVIVGGESGPHARPFDLAWARSIVRQCRAYQIPCFMKQMGSKPFDSEHQSDREGFTNVVSLKDSHGGDPSEWPAGDWPREWPTPRFPHV